MYKYLILGFFVLPFAWPYLKEIILILKEIRLKIRKANHMKKVENPVGVWVNNELYMEHTISEKISSGYLMTYEVFFKNDMKLKSRQKYTTDIEGKNTRFIGEQVSYYENGQLEFIKNFENGVIIDPILTIYHENGGVKLTIPHECSQPHGESKAFDENGNLVRVDNYVYGDLTGKWVVYYLDGSILQEGNYFNGKWHGIVREYFPNRQLKIDGEFEYDKSIREIFYHENGRVEEQWNFVDGKPDGEVITYNENGEIIHRKMYNHGEVIATDD